MTPDPSAVAELDASLSSKNMGVVAHYYMDAELQVCVDIRDGLQRY